MRALHKKKSVKAIVISGISLLLVAAIVVGVLWYLGHRSEPVKVAPRVHVYGLALEREHAVRQRDGR